MARAKVVAKAKTGVTVKKSPVKAGSTHRQHGGLPTRKVILITSKIKADIEKRNNNG